MTEKTSQQPPPAVGPCPTLIQISTQHHPATRLSLLEGGKDHRKDFMTNYKYAPHIYISSSMILFGWLRGWSGGAKVLGKLPVPGRPTNLDYSGARAYSQKNILSSSCDFFLPLVK